MTWQYTEAEERLILEYISEWELSWLIQKNLVELKIPDTKPTSLDFIGRGFSHDFTLMALNYDRRLKN